MLNDREKEYVASVCGYVKWKRAHENIKEDLSAHIEDQKEAFLKKGLSEEDASDAAVAEMGDAALVGSSMNAAYRENTSIPLLAVFIAIVAAGCVLRANYSTADGFISSLIIGIGIFLAVWRILRLDHIMSSAWVIIAIYAAVVLTIFFGALASLIPMINGMISVISYIAVLQPVVFALLLWKLRGKGLFALLIAFVYCAVTLMPLVIIPQMFVFAAIAVSDVLILIYAINKKWLGKNKWQLMAVAAAVIAAVIILCLLLMSAYRLGRLSSYLGFTGNYFIEVTRDIIGNCRFIGGADAAGMSAVSEEWLNQIGLSGDYMLTALAVNIGLCIFFIIGTPLCFMSYMLIKKALKEKSMFCRMLMLACSLVFTIQWCAYLASNLGLITAGVLPLPFLAPGGLSFIANMLIMGLMFCVYSTGSLYSDKAAAKIKGEEKKTLCRF